MLYLTTRATIDGSMFWEGGLRNPKNTSEFFILDTAISFVVLSDHGIGHGTSHRVALGFSPPKQQFSGDLLLL